MPWKKDEIKFLEENYQTMIAKDIAESLGRTLTSITKKAHWLKLRKTGYSREQYRKLVIISNETAYK
jgi:prophage antirepressor-like protein